MRLLLLLFLVCGRGRLGRDAEADSGDWEIEGDGNDSDGGLHEREAGEEIRLVHSAMYIVHGLLFVATARSWHGSVHLLIFMHSK